MRQEGLPRSEGVTALRLKTSGMAREFDVIVERDGDGSYLASVPVVAGCHTQARSLDELMQRVREAIELCLKIGAGPA